MPDLLRLVTGDIERFVVSDDAGEGVICSINKTDGGVFIPISEVEPIGGTWTPTRIAANDVVLRKTAAADTTHLVATLRPYFRTTASKGILVKSIDVAYSIGTAALTTHTFNISAVTYANNTAVAVAAHGGSITGTLATATQANPYLTNLLLGTQSFVITAGVDVRLEIEVVAALTSAYDLYGLFVNYDFNNL